MEKYSKKLVNYFPQQVIFLGYFAILFGVYSLFNHDLKGVIFIIGGISFSFTTINIAIDFDNLLYKEHINILGLPFGKWRELPPYKYITAYKETLSQTMGVQSISRMQSNTKICLDIVFSKDEKLRLGIFDEKEEALKVGAILAKNLNTKLVDYTNKTPRWMED